MEEMLTILKEALDIRNSIAKQEAALWGKIYEALNSYMLHQQSLDKEKSPTHFEPPKSPPKGTYLSNKQAAEYLGLNIKMLDKWRVKGGGPKFAKMGHLVRYKVEDLEEFAAKNSYPHTSAYNAKKQEFLSWQSPRR